MALYTPHRCAETRASATLFMYPSGEDRLMWGAEVA